MPTPTRRPVPSAAAARDPVLLLPWPGAAPVLRAAEPEPAIGRPALDALRRVAARCRLARRIEIDDALSEARAALPAGARGPSHGCAAISAEAAAAGLLRALPSLIGVRPVFHVPGSREVSFDEAWLARLLAALRAGDGDSVRLLVARAARAERSALAILANALAARIEALY